jgi:DnaD/phage-associated family protein
MEDNITSINNKKEEEEKIQNDLKDIINFYENNITMITALVADSMEMYLKEGLSANLIIEAMKEAVFRNKRNWKYVTGILNDCINNKIHTVQQFKIKQEEFKSNKKQNDSQKQAKEKIEYKESELTEEEYFANLKGKKHV